MCSQSHATLARAAAFVSLSIGAYASIRNQYAIEVEASIQEYLFDPPDARITKFRNQMKQAIVGAFVPAFEMGLEDGGGDAFAEGEDLAWINAKVEAEFKFVDVLFEQLKALKKQSAEDGLSILEGVAVNRADGYARTLDGIYSHGKLSGAKNKMLTFGGDDGFESCATCRRLKGQRHKASWWKARDLMPYRGNSNLECGGWQCQHFLFDDQGNIFSF
jgi:hypothetical protein